MSIISRIKEILGFSSDVPSPPPARERPASNLRAANTLQKSIPDPHITRPEKQGRKSSQVRTYSQREADTALQGILLPIPPQVSQPKRQLTSSSGSQRPALPPPSNNKSTSTYNDIWKSSANEETK